MKVNYENSHNNIHILVVDDEEPIRNLLQKMIKADGYECSTAESGREALRVLENKDVDVVITDIKMPDLNGIELLSVIKTEHNSDVIVITGVVEDFTYEKVIEIGASDFVYKPFSSREFMIRLKRVLRERMLLAEQKESNKKLREAYFDTINRLVLAAEYKDEDTGDHIVRMSRYSTLIAEEIGRSADELQIMLYAAPMHDIGKIGIPDSILFKPGKLNDKEFKIMQTHTTIGANILSNSKADILDFAHKIAISHHEKWNGKGYPQGLSGNKIPLLGRIVGLADVFDALTSVRPYKNPYPVEIAIDIMKKERGEHFDPDILDVFLENVEEILKIKKEVGSEQDVSLTEFVWSERDRAEMAVSADK